MAAQLSVCHQIKKNTRNGLKHYLRKKPYILHLIPLNPIECTLRDVRESNP